MCLDQILCKIRQMLYEQTSYDMKIYEKLFKLKLKLEMLHWQLVLVIQLSIISFSNSIQSISKYKCIVQCIFDISSENVEMWDYCVIFPGDTSEKQET